MAARTQNEANLLKAIRADEMVYGRKDGIEIETFELKLPFFSIVNIGFHTDLPLFCRY